MGMATKLFLPVERRIKTKVVRLSNGRINVEIYLDTSQRRTPITVGFSLLELGYLQRQIDDIMASHPILADDEKMGHL